MKRLYLISLILLTLLGAGCGADSPDCFKASGDLERVTLEVSEFSRITVFENIQLVVKHGSRQEVILETGKNLRAGVTAEVVDGILELRDANSCNFFRSYGKTIFYVTTPDLEAIRSSTGWPIRSEGVLPFDTLSLTSESFNNQETNTNDGSFDLDLEVNRLTVVSNGIAYFKLRGQASQFLVTIASGDSKVDARELLSETVRVNHRGSNDISVSPIMRISGIINGYGDVLSFERPPEVDVEETFRGRLIFMD
ncbi:head GIN domain-containing protein [Robiginitalea aurantiaca]|uniref:Head GIN domain-containing protein n=1 Tax=Robiginitalea aurantiaca TaxID=3056915 RepID=A0ABT7WHW8_9FLAO|nr:head GIN domain-containing protein [Robiginitalea aurantiaca]MDM9632501.1 head GIN domain-containing protein [Robiginitalea aurantiaca]